MKNDNPFMFREKLDYSMVLINQLERIGKSTSNQEEFADNVDALEIFISPYTDENFNGLGIKAKLKKIMKVMANLGLLLEVTYEEEI